MKATVVIPTFNRSRRLAELLRCLVAQPRESLSRVVVCDDGSSDDTQSVTREFESLLPVLYSRQDNRGFRAGQARNMGLSRATGDVVIFLDDDVLVAPDFVDQHLLAHSAKSGPKIAIGYRHRAFGFRREVPTWDEITGSEPDDRTEVLGDDGSGIAAHETPWFFVYSCNFSIALTANTPRFDDSFVGWGMEDIEYGYRLNTSGYEVICAPRARVLHIEDPKPRDPFRCEVRQIAPTYDSYVRNSVYFMDKYPHDPALAKMIRTDMQWYVQDAAGSWVKNGFANDVDAVLAQCRRDRESRYKSALDASQVNNAPTAPAAGE